MAVEVQGVRETLYVLRTLDKSIYYKTLGRMKKAAGPVKAHIDGNFPAGPPLSGFDHNGRTGWRRKKKTDIKVGGRRKKTGDFPLLRIIVKDAPRQIFDLATGDLGRQLSGYGPPSRAAWRGTDVVLRDVEPEVRKAIEQASKEANRKLRYV